GVTCCRDERFERLTNFDCASASAKVSLDLWDIAMASTDSKIRESGGLSLCHVGGRCALMMILSGKEYQIGTGIVCHLYENKDTAQWCYQWVSFPESVS
ncbi:unnamed protein product, partial [Fusarium graminearum]